MKPRIIILAGDHDTTSMVYHALTKECDIVRVIIEEPVSRYKLFKWRMKRFGSIEAVGQVLFIFLVQPFLVRSTQARRQEIIKEAGLSAEPIPSEVCMRVSSINNSAVIDELVRLRPTYVIVHGTRIISKKILHALEVHVPFINIHAGITPRYRGSHGAYWALVQNDAEHCGVTVHLVDTGIDTGGILAQGRIIPKVCDNFMTYPLLQLTLGLRLLLDVLRQGTLKPRTLMEEEPSGMWAHPTLWGYVWWRLLKGVR